MLLQSVHYSKSQGLCLIFIFTQKFPIHFLMLCHIFKDDTNAEFCQQAYNVHNLLEKDAFWHFFDYNISDLKKESVHPMTNCHGTYECGPLGYNRRSNDITRLLIQRTLQTEFRSTHLDK